MHLEKTKKLIDHPTTSIRNSNGRGKRSRVDGSGERSGGFSFGISFVYFDPLVVYMANTSP
ncbi:hypothetical protein LINGRAHAP2_LOCUS7595, partial [Linum grandiflorum]